MKRIEFSKIKDRIFEMPFEKDEYRTLKRNVAAACFALCQSPYKQDIIFNDNSEWDVVILHYTSANGEQIIRRIISIPYDGFLYDEICDELGLE